MKIQKANFALAISILMMSFSGCASLSLQPTDKAELPVASKPDSLEFKFGLARLLERNGKLEEARRAYLEILSFQPHAPSLHRLGVTAVRQNRLEAGLSHLSEAVNAGNPTAELLGDLGYAQYLAGNLTGAEKTLTNAVTLNPSLKRNLNNLAIVIGNQDRPNESLQLFRQAAPEAEALANLAFIQAQANDLSQAQANYSRALDLDPELEIAAVGLMEVHKHLQTQTELNARQRTGSNFSQVAQSQPSQQSRPQTVLPEQRIVQEGLAQQRLAQKRLAQAQPIAPPVAPSTYTGIDFNQAVATNRVAETMQRPLQLLSRSLGDSSKRVSSKATHLAKAAETLGTGTFQPPAFPNSNSSGAIALASYQEEVVDQPPPQTAN